MVGPTEHKCNSRTWASRPAPAPVVKRQSWRRESAFDDQHLAESDAVLIVDVEQGDGDAADGGTADQYGPSQRKCFDHLWRRGLNSGVILRVTASTLVRSEPLNELQ